MNPLSQHIKISYAKVMADNAIPARSQNFYFKWLCFILTFSKNIIMISIIR